jgi:hypothetical protein
LKEVSIERSTNVSFDKFNISDWEKKEGENQWLRSKI